MEHVAECIRQERIVKLWMHFRAARAARDAISYFRTVANRQRKSDKARRATKCADLEPAES